MSVTAVESNFPGISPTYLGQNAYHWIAAEGRCLALPGQHARLFSLSVNRSLAGLVVYVYDGWSATGTLVAKIDGSTKGTYTFGGVRFPNGIFIDVIGTGTFDVTASLDGQEPRGGALTLSGNEITDNSRATATQGDGRSSTGTLTVSGNELSPATRGASLTTASTGQMMDQYPVLRDTNNFLETSYGIHRGATNLFRRGQCDALTDCSAITAGVTRALDATIPPPFSTQSIMVACDGSTGTQGVFFSTATAQAAAATTIGVGSVYFKGTAGLSYTFQLRWANTDASTTSGGTVSVVATGAWQLATPPSLAVAAGKTGDRLDVIAFCATTRIDTFWAAHAMLESGQSVVAPYVATAGGATASHSAGRIQFPASLLSPTQSWVAFRMRMRYAAGVNINSSAGSPRLLHSAVDGNNSLLSFVSNADYATVNMRRQAGGITGTAAAQLGSWAAGDYITVIAAWEATRVRLSLNGAAFTNAADTNIPTMTALVDIGSLTGSASYAESDFMWVATGTGVLTDAQAATIAGFGNTDPSMNAFPTAAQATMLWDGSSITYLNAPDTSMGIWEGTTNGVKNGGFETNTTGWFAAGTVAAVISQDATHVKFGTQAMKVVTSGTGAGEGVAITQTTDKVAAVAGQTWTCSCWVWAPVGAALAFNVNGYDAGNVLTADVFPKNFTGTGDWQRVTSTVLLAAGTTAGIAPRVVTASAAAMSFWLDGAQVEQKPCATPYVETNGAAASRTAAHIEAPQSLLGPAQGWAVARLRVGFPSTTATLAGLNATVFSIDDGSSNNRIQAVWSPGAPFAWQTRWVVGGAAASALTVADTFALGDFRTVIMKWDTANHSLSINGAAFAAAAHASAPVVNVLEVGTGLGGGSQLDGDVCWFACGSGTLTDADAARIDSWGCADPLPSWFPTAAACTMVWHGNGTQYITP